MNKKKNRKFKIMGIWCIKCGIWRSSSWFARTVTIPAPPCTKSSVVTLLTRFYTTKLIFTFFTYVANLILHPSPFWYISELHATDLTSCHSAIKMRTRRCREDYCQPATAGFVAVPIWQSHHGLSHTRRRLLRSESLN